MKRTTSRLCALCDKVIPDTYVVCHDHFEDYKLYKNEPWFQDLVMAQRRQFQIDIEETALASGDRKITKPYQWLTESEKRSIRFLRSKKLGAQSIAKLTGINIHTIKNYIYNKNKQKNS